MIKIKGNINEQSNKNIKKLIIAFSLILFFVIAINTINGLYVSGEPTIPVPNVNLNITEAENPQEVTSSIQLLLILTVLSIAPAILIMMTSFTRIVIVLSFLRNAIATQQTPPTQVILGFALFLTFFVMTPVINNINDNALQPYLNEEISQGEALSNTMEPLREFMLRQTREQDLELFLELGNYQVQTINDVPNTALIPAFIISELKTAFQIGFILFLPFIVIDMVVASTLMSMGMMMLPPAMISLPFKLLLFIMVDGWNIITQSLVMGFR
ncbi:flagellar type III secretion system pore protein FliP [Serpentinicella sp. ANB-PHB4]|uniref:flagellar type III secretion system pore protein FliP n=1 Tax=Serpentinicella sp. ANB-PHB4 TaxID=3074076 RepID=UPI00285D6DC0|nr:flagellar type III secretion system pore protein FliP [Serpentinicella sp. ANB-PHB4]MDR5658254.1 flagellar type III secretion system pore protein FliP [Serpentinicella sp. ANB-PHB4]